MADVELQGDAWRVEVAGPRFERFFRRLPERESAVTVAAIEQVLARIGIAICESEWGKPLGGGLYEFRIRRDVRAPTERLGGRGRVLIRVLCAFEGNRVILLLGGYDKLRDPSKRRQQREIRAAAAVLRAWRA